MRFAGSHVASHGHKLPRNRYMILRDASVQEGAVTIAEKSDSAQLLMMLWMPICLLLWDTTDTWSYTAVCMCEP